MRPTLVVAWLCTVGTGCSNAAERASTKTGEPLVGAWESQWTLEKPSERNVVPAKASVVHGRLALIVASPHVKSLNFADLAGRAFFGVYDAEFDAFGFPANGLPPLVSVSRAGRDSVEVVLNPQSDHGGLIMRGRLSGDSLVGVWSQSVSGGASGHFVMRKQ